MLSITALLKNNNKSGNTAKERLKLVLVHDRVNTSPELLENIRKDIIEVLSKYAEIDVDDFNIDISSAGLQEKIPTISANIPLKEIRR